MLKRALPILFVLLFLYGCGTEGNNLEKLHGNWVLDKKATVDMIKEYKDMSAKMKEQYAEKLKNIQFKCDVLSKEIYVNDVLYRNELYKTLKINFVVKNDSGNKLSIEGGRYLQMDIIFNNKNTIVVSTRENSSLAIQTTFNDLKKFVMIRQK